MDLNSLCKRIKGVEHTTSKLIKTEKERFERSRIGKYGCPWNLNVSFFPLFGLY
jgi:hypothetical protein